MMVALNIVDQHLLEIAAADELARLRRYQEAWEAYHGDSPEPLKPIKGQAGDGVIVNYARMVVDKGVSFLFGQDVKFELDESGQTPEEDWLAECWTANGGMTTLQKMALNGGVCGHTFAKLALTSGRRIRASSCSTRRSVRYDQAILMRCCGTASVCWPRRAGRMVTYRQLIGVMAARGRSRIRCRAAAAGGGRAYGRWPMPGRRGGLQNRRCRTNITD